VAALARHRRRETERSYTVRVVRVDWIYSDRARPSSIAGSLSIEQVVGL
jgi:hypothetical protein